MEVIQSAIMTSSLINLARTNGTSTDRLSYIPRGTHIQMEAYTYGIHYCTNTHTHIDTHTQIKDTNT